MALITVAMSMLEKSALKLQRLRMHNVVVVMILTFSTFAAQTTNGQFVASIGNEGSGPIEGESIVTLVKLV